MELVYIPEFKDVMAQFETEQRKIDIQFYTPELKTGNIIAYLEVGIIDWATTVDLPYFTGNVYLRKITHTVLGYPGLLPTHIAMLVAEPEKDVVAAVQPYISNLQLENRVCQFTKRAGKHMPMLLHLIPPCKPTEIKQ